MATLYSFALWQAAVVWQNSALAFVEYLVFLVGVTAAIVGFVLLLTRIQHFGSMAFEESVLAVYFRHPPDAVRSAD